MRHDRHVQTSHSLIKTTSDLSFICRPNSRSLSSLSYVLIPRQAKLCIDTSLNAYLEVIVPIWGLKHWPVKCGLSCCEQNAGSEVYQVCVYINPRLVLGSNFEAASSRVAFTIFVRYIIMPFTDSSPSCISVVQFTTSCGPFKEPAAVQLWISNEVGHGL